MRYKQFGRTGLMVSELCFGAMTFGGTGMWQAVGQIQQDEADTILKAAFDGGVNFVDTANVYSTGESERITGQALKNLGIARSDVVLATKVMGPMGEGVNDRGTSRYHIMDQVGQSLERLGTDHIDLYQIHGWDPLTPIEEALRALDDCVRSGMVRYVGVSNWAAWQVIKALGISDRLNLARFESLQAYYTIAGRDLERELIPMLGAEKMALMVWSPLAGGLLSGKYPREDTSKGEGRRAGFDFPPVNKERAWAAIDAMKPMAEARGASIAQIAIAWLLHQEAVTSVIIGAKRLDQLEDNLKACDIELRDEDLAELDEITRLPREYPGWMFERQNYRAQS